MGDSDDTTYQAAQQVRIRSALVVPDKARALTLALQTAPLVVSSIRGSPWINPFSVLQVVESFHPNAAGCRPGYLVLLNQVTG